VNRQLLARLEIEIDDLEIWGIMDQKGLVGLFVKTA
jgi:hypothetical protein